MLRTLLFSLFWIAAINILYTYAHGRLLDPPSRMSAWRFGFPVPKNYYDHGMNCGGRDVQWRKNGGKCGICGDSWSGPRFYERPNGIFVQHEVITKTYRENSVIKVTVELTVAHMGWTEFRICNLDKLGGIEATQKCLNETILASPDGQTRFNFNVRRVGLFEFSLLLPIRLTCRHCVLQWKWKTGNSWGCEDQKCGLGQGDVQEEFYGCSDVTILPAGAPVPTIYPTKRPINRFPFKPSGRDFSLMSLPKIMHMFKLVDRTFNVSEPGDDLDLDLDDVIPNTISGQDYLQALVSLKYQAKLPFVQ